ncbi:MAG: hypothetical protein P4L84_31665 [Isosphaeraceae bacterium]|nr:hypothetical protein [Isosphaeraceae bacterium]
MTDATRTRKEVARYGRKVQRTFLVPEGEEATETEGGAGTATPPAPAPATRVSGPPPCRMALARWPDEWRERWGRRANALEDTGLPWHEAEAQAFVEIWNERRALGQTDPEHPEPGSESAAPERN